jgi:hypothetical protein
MYHLAWYSIATIDNEADILIAGVLKEKDGGWVSEGLTRD